MINIYCEEMQLGLTSKLKKLTKNWLFWLIVITSLAIFIRSIPAWTNAAWGCDFGIYLGLTNSLVKSGELFNPYYGWGGSYQYFPVLYAVTGIGHWISGIDTLTLMSKIAPIFGGLSVLIFYFVVYELIGDRKIALLSSLFFAVLPFHVYQTSHAAPLTMGHFFMMLSLYIFIKYRQDMRYFIPLFISTILLIMSHHLTTYFYLIILIFIVFSENAASKTWTSTIKKDVFYILLTSVLVFAYWAFIARTVFDSFMRSGLRIGGIRLESVYILVIFYLIYVFSFLLIKYIRKLNLYLINSSIQLSLENMGYKKYLIKIISKLNPYIKKNWPSTESRIKYFLISLTLIYSIVGLFTVVKMPWTGFAFPPQSVIYMTPFLIAIALAIVGFRYTLFLKNGQFIRGWILAVVISFLYSIITNSGIILPDRHPEYAMAPMAILVVYGLGGIFSDANYHALFSKLSCKTKLFVNYMKQDVFIGYKKRQAHFFIVIVLVILLGSTVYVAHRSLNISVEEITNEDVAIFNWMDKNLDKNTSVIASDHRLARMAESYGFNTTIDQAIAIWTAKNLTGCIDELYGIGKNYSKITHIVIDDIMKDIVVHVGAVETVYMTNETSQEAYEKFLQQPFELIYRNETIDPNTKTATRWADVYEVNWTYIEKLSLI